MLFKLQITLGPAHFRHARRELLRTTALFALVATLWYLSFMRCPAKQARIMNGPAVLAGGPASPPVLSFPSERRRKKRNYAFLAGPQACLSSPSRVKEEGRSVLLRKVTQRIRGERGKISLRDVVRAFSTLDSTVYTGVGRAPQDKDSSKGPFAALFDRGSVMTARGDRSGPAEKEKKERDSLEMHQGLVRKHREPGRDAQDESEHKRGGDIP